MNYKDYLRQSLKEDAGDWPYGGSFNTGIYVDDLINLGRPTSHWEGGGLDGFGEMRPDVEVQDKPGSVPTNPGDDGYVWDSMEDYYRYTYGDEWYDEKFGEEEEEDETEVEPNEEPELDTELSQEELDAILDAMKHYNVVR
jgi:hypothetical protein|tara:strand:+ start:5978 stop:6400 length:423 start_codon:yes stop_codon:yes gene_type:complete